MREGRNMGEAAEEAQNGWREGGALSDLLFRRAQRRTAAWTFADCGRISCESLRRAAAWSNKAVFCDLERRKALGNDDRDFRRGMAAPELVAAAHAHIVCARRNVGKGYGGCRTDELRSGRMTWRKSNVEHEA